MWRGDTDTGCSIAGSFTTVTTTGAPTALTGTAGSVCLVCYRLHPGDAVGFTCSTAGITLALDCGGRTGWNTWEVRTAVDLAFYACGHDYELVIQGGTVGGTCVSGYQVAGFSLKNRGGLRPTVPGRTLDVDASGRVLTQPCSTTFSVTSVLNNVPGVTAGVTVTTNNDKTGYALTAAYDFAKGTTAMTESYAANGVAFTPAQGLYAIHQMLQQFAISGTTYTVKKLDNTTTAFEVTLDDATNPSGAARV